MAPPVSGRSGQQNGASHKGDAPSLFFCSGTANTLFTRDKENIVHSGFLPSD